MLCQAQSAQLFSMAVLELAQSTGGQLLSWLL